ncbi:MAG: Nre family DNA repair protein [Candidatus Jordarchaeum sp.]|uniref:Nre family DNA repair protein n=1 Tax=Candidatus Jordarchaeum sp. TaxID=2823881 RepID=UPI00404B234C
MGKQFSGKFVKEVKKRIPWIEHLIEDYSTALEFNTELIDYSVPKQSICLLCRGTRMLCGKKRCPLLERFYSYVKVSKSFDGTQLVGDSPPSAFVGRRGYPYVYAGPMVPPERGDTGIYDIPELWYGKDVEEIIGFRYKLVRGMFITDVREANSDNKLLRDTRELALAGDPVDSEVILKKKPKHRLLLSSEVQPMGPSAPLENINIGTLKVPKIVDKVYFDTDLKALDGMLMLYEDNLPVTRIQRILSVGAMGVKNNRKLVPTRWSITAVDSSISKFLRENVKDFPLINDYLVYETDYLDNRFVVLMIPRPWSYELIEAWFPGTLWNPDQEHVGMGSDWEPYWGRTTYASIGGCYYAARLAVTEHLLKERRQAAAVIFRETLPGNLMPLGVWLVRECVRDALRKEPMKFETLESALQHIKTRLRINMKHWLQVSGALSEIRKQRLLTEFLGF